METTRFSVVYIQFMTSLLPVLKGFYLILYMHHYDLNLSTFSSFINIRLLPFAHINSLSMTHWPYFLTFVCFSIYLITNYFNSLISLSLLLQDKRALKNKYLYECCNVSFSFNIMTL